MYTSHNENFGSKFWELFSGKLKRFKDADVIFSEDMRSEFYLDDAFVIPNGISLKKYNVDLDIYIFIYLDTKRAQDQKFLIKNAKKTSKSRS